MDIMKLLKESYKNAPSRVPIDDYFDALRYMKEINKKDFVDNINSIFEVAINDEDTFIRDTLGHNVNLYSDSESSIVRKKEKRELLSKALRKKLEGYSRQNFYKNLSLVFDYHTNSKLNIYIDTINDRKIAESALEKMSSIAISATHLSLLDGYTRANIALQKDNGVYDNIMIGDTLGFNLMDVL